jgi:hypothetical protein
MPSATLVVKRRLTCFGGVYFRGYICILDASLFYPKRCTREYYNNRI